MAEDEASMSRLEQRVVIYQRHAAVRIFDVVKRQDGSIYIILVVQIWAESKRGPRAAEHCSEPLNVRALCMIRSGSHALWLSCSGGDARVWRLSGPPGPSGGTVMA